MGYCMACNRLKRTKSSLDSCHVVHLVTGQLNIDSLHGVGEVSLVAASGVWATPVVGDRGAVCTTVVEVGLQNHK